VVRNEVPCHIALLVLRECVAPLPGQVHAIVFSKDPTWFVCTIEPRQSLAAGRGHLAAVVFDDVGAVLLALRGFSSQVPMVAWGRNVLKIPSIPLRFEIRRAA
jgi:hypothetical protein